MSWGPPPLQSQPRAVRYSGIKVHTYTPDAFSWAPSLHEWWLCRQHGPYLIPLAGIAQRQCDPWAFAPTFSLLGFDHLRNVFAAEDKKDEKKRWKNITQQQEEQQLPGDWTSGALLFPGWQACDLLRGWRRGGEKRTNELALTVNKTAVSTPIRSLTLETGAMTWGRLTQGCEFPSARPRFCPPTVQFSTLDS